MLLSKIARIFAPKPEMLTAHTLYISALGQARNPFFYEQLCVPDTIDGRFDMVVLHVSLINDRLRECGEKTEPLRGALVDSFMADMDQTLREQSIGDSGILHKVQRMGEAYFGREKTYFESLNNTEKLRGALLRNVYNCTEDDASDGARDGASHMCDYCQEAQNHLRAQAAEALMAGNVTWPDITSPATKTGAA